MRATAEAKGRDPHIAEAFVDPEVSIPHLKPDGKLLTLTAEEATKEKFVNGQVRSETDIFSALEIQQPRITAYQITAVDHIISFLVQPLVSALLIILIIGGIYVELQAPGIGGAIIIALLAAILYFAPLYLQGLADYWEIALFIFGIVLLILEIFVIPGFGIAGILGIISVVLGLSFSLVANDFFDFKLSHPGMLFNSFLIVIGAMVISVTLMVIFGKNLLKSSAFQRLVLADEQKAEEGYTSSIIKSDLLNRRGITKTVMRPSGKIEIDGVWYDAVALDGFIELGQEVYVEKHENYNLFVRKINA